MAHPSKGIYAGTWETPEEAAIACDRVALHLGLKRALHFEKKSRALGPASAQQMKQAANDAAAQQKKYRNGFLGVSRSAQGKFGAVPVQNVYAGFWDTAEQAALARDRVILHMGLTRALNFPERSRALGPASTQEMAEAARVARAATQTSRYRGVHFDAQRGQWIAASHLDAKTFALGRFEHEIDAAHAYDKAVWNFKGKRGVLNFAPPTRRPTGRLPPGKEPRPKTSRYRGVAQLGVKGVMQSVGMFVSEEDAAEAHDRLCLHFGLPAEELNFPNRKLKSASLEVLREETRRAYKETTSSQYRGVCWDMNRECWAARIQVDRRQKALGRFDNEEDAARAYDRAALSLHEQPKLNFPDDGPRTKRKRSK